MCFFDLVISALSFSKKTFKVIHTILTGTKTRVDIHLNIFIIKDIFGILQSTYFTNIAGRLPRQNQFFDTYHFNKFP